MMPGAAPRDLGANCTTGPRRGRELPHRYFAAGVSACLESAALGSRSGSQMSLSPSMLREYTWLDCLSVALARDGGRAVSCLAGAGSALRCASGGLAVPCAAHVPGRADLYGAGDWAELAADHVAWPPVAARPQEVPYDGV